MSFLYIKKLFLLFLFVNVVVFTNAQAPKRELRGAWIATVSNIDWPSATGLPAATQQAQLISILDQHKASGLNAVFLQIRTQCDALYNSPYDPWSSFLTGTQGNNPGYDPLQFAITECRKRGLELHAWMNPYRAVINSSQLSSFASSHIAIERPDLLLSQGTLRILDPGKTEVWDSVIKVVMDVVRRYDIDGIHFDDYFYPYPPSSGAPFDDAATFAAQPRGFTNVADWRRANVDTLIKRANDSIHNAKPWVKFGVSPFGIWRNSSSDPLGSATSGLQSYSDVYANSRKWIQNNWVDYLAPQNYWSIGFAAANYGVLIPWWNNNALARHIYSGMAAYKVNNGGTDANWTNPSQIPNQIRLNRQHSKVLGSIYYNSTSVNSNPLGMRDSLRNDFYKRAALLPTMPWIDNNPPQAPSNVNTTIQGTTNVLVQWNAPPATTVELDKARQYVVYRFATSTINLTDSSAIRTVTPVDTLQFIDTNVPNGTYYYVVTSLDRTHNESVASNAAIVTLGTTNINTVITGLGYFKVLASSSKYQIAYEITTTSTIQLNVLNPEGKIVYKNNYGKRLIGNYIVDLPTNGLAKGVYYAQLVVNGNLKTKQFFIQ